MRFAACCFAAITLSGCTGVYDENMIGPASAARALAIDQCRSRGLSGEFTTAGAYIECELVADRQFVTAARLKDMALYAAYEARMRLAASDIDAGRVPANEAGARFQAIRDDFRGQVETAYAADQAQRARMSAGLMAMGAGMQAAGASYNAGAYGYAPPTRPVICNTTPGRLDGSGGATTICH